jgi:hypothetical protein
MLPKLMDQAAEAAGCVAEACGSLRGAKSFDEISTQRFILAMIALGRSGSDPPRRLGVRSDL